MRTFNSVCHVEMIETFPSVEEKIRSLPENELVLSKRRIENYGVPPMKAVTVRL